MSKFKTVLLIVGILVAGMAFNTVSAASLDAPSATIAKEKNKNKSAKKKSGQWKMKSKKLRKPEEKRDAKLLKRDWKVK